MRLQLRAIGPAAAGGVSLGRGAARILVDPRDPAIDALGAPLGPAGGPPA